MQPNAHFSLNNQKSSHFQACQGRDVNREQQDLHTRALRKSVGQRAHTICNRHCRSLLNCHDAVTASRINVNPTAACSWWRHLQPYLAQGVSPTRTKKPFNLGLRLSHANLKSRIVSDHISGTWCNQQSFFLTDSQKKTPKRRQKNKTTSGYLTGHHCQVRLASPWRSDKRFI